MRALAGAGAGMVIIWALLGGPSELGAEGRPTSVLWPCALHVQRTSYGGLPGFAYTFIGISRIGDHLGLTAFRARG